MVHAWMAFNQYFSSFHSRMRLRQRRDVSFLNRAIAGSEVFMWVLRWNITMMQIVMIGVSTVCITKKLKTRMQQHQSHTYLITERNSNPRVFLATSWIKRPIHVNPDASSPSEGFPNRPLYKIWYCRKYNNQWLARLRFSYFRCL